MEGWKRERKNERIASVYWKGQSSAIVGENYCDLAVVSFISSCVKEGLR
jgi:hypothetical protein